MFVFFNIYYYRIFIFQFSSTRPVPDERNVNGHRGDLNPKRAEEEPKEPVRNHPRSGAKPSVRPNAMKNRGKQLEALKLMEERIQKLKVYIFIPI